MKKPVRFLALVLLSVVGLLLVAGPSEAQMMRRFGGGGTFRPQPFPPNRMPGWDWWRIYPWSPYNYGRNPYNPAIIPYPYVVPDPYPVYTPYPSYYGDASSLNGQMGTSTTVGPPSLLLPQPTAPIYTPPSGQGEIQLTVPDTFAEVYFDGYKTSSIGSTRYYVTPQLEPGREYDYDMTVRWNQNGQPVSRDRKVAVRAGQKTVIDLSQYGAAE
jgi:uncharacterized protein (TIGR03000 family)